MVLGMLVVLMAGGCGSAGAPRSSGGADADAEPDAAADVRAEAARPATDIAAGDASADTTVTADAAGEAAPLRCNGHEALCDRRFDEVVFPATHNAMSSAEDGFLAPNQTHGIKRQLEDGVRALLIDTHAWRGGSYLCHAICEFGNRPLVDGLRDVGAFLRAHPHDVVTLIIEDGISAADTDAAFRQAGLTDLVYVHTGAWPTLRQMIARNQRLLVTAEKGGPPPPWYQHVWDLAWDTPYSFKSPADFSCQQNRGRRSNDLFLLNHWLENPLASESLSATANARDLLLGRARQCQRESGKLPNFVAVNHYSVGSLFEVVRALNGL
jgi:hypothetical protein